jgi:hypothetical protein
MTRRQILRLRLRAKDLRASNFAPLPFVALLLLLHSVSPAGRPEWHAFVLVAGYMAAMLGLLAGGTAWDRRRKSVEAASPDAVRAIREGLAGTGLPIPDQVVLAPWNGCRAGLRTWPRRGVRLEVPLPTLLALPLADLPVVAAAALSVGQVTRYPVAAQRLWRKRLRAEQVRAVLLAQGDLTVRRRRRLDAFLASTETFARDVRLRADQAATAVAGSPGAATRMLYAEHAANADAFAYTARFQRLIASKRRVPASLYEAWFAQWSTAPKWLQARTLVAPDAFHSVHPGLGPVDLDVCAGWVADLRAGGAGAAAQSAVSPRIAGDLASRATMAMALSGNVSRPVRTEKIALGLVYDDRAEDDVILAAATEVLGRHADRLDVVELFRARRGYDLAAVLEPYVADPNEPDGCLSRDRIFAALLVSALKENRMRQLDPYREWIFTGSDGTRVDAGQVVADALASDDGMGQLCALLRPGGAFAP